MAKLRGYPVMFWALVIAALALAACGPGRSPETIQTQKGSVKDGGSYTDVDAAGLATMLEGKDFLLINVHIPYEGEIEGTDLFVPYNEAERKLDKLPAEKDSKLVVYCRSESMSTVAARTLVEFGYTNVWNLKGGMIAWKQAGHTLVYKK